MYATNAKINTFLTETLGLDVRKVVSITNLRPKQQIWISFLEEGDVMDFEKKIFNGVIFPESGVKVDGKIFIVICQ